MERKYWVLRCKVCHRLHRGDPVKESERVLDQGPAAREIACPDRPSKWASYTLDDWTQMTEAEWDALRQFE